MQTSPSSSTTPTTINSSPPVELSSLESFAQTIRAQILQSSNSDNIPPLQIIKQSNKLNNNNFLSHANRFQYQILYDETKSITFGVWRFSENAEGPPNCAHGGAIGTAIEYTFQSHIDHHVKIKLSNSSLISTTSDINVIFERPIPLCSLVVVRAWITTTTTNNNHYTMECDVVSIDYKKSTLIRHARGTANLIITNNRKSTENQPITIPNSDISLKPFPSLNQYQLNAITKLSDISKFQVPMHFDFTDNITTGHSTMQIRFFIGTITTTTTTPSFIGLIFFTHLCANNDHNYYMPITTTSKSAIYTAFDEYCTTYLFRIRKSRYYTLSLKVTFLKDISLDTVGVFETLILEERSGNRPLFTMKVSLKNEQEILCATGFGIFAQVLEKDMSPEQFARTKELL
jgi:acyl-coenzyme A thioesterase PaaI-like protein